MDKNLLLKVKMNNTIKEYLLETGKRYWNLNDIPIRKLDIPSIDKKNGFETIKIRLPYWASGIGIGKDNHILIYKRFTEGEDYRQCDWWNAAFFMLNSIHEREYEDKNGSIQSYSFRLKGFDKHLFEYAWVNRIFMFLRRWASELVKNDEEIMFGPLPDYKVHISHDLDYIRHSIPLRLKQGAFNLFNTLKGGFSKKYLKQSMKILFLNYDFISSINKMISIDKIHNIDSNYYVFPGSKTDFNSILIDPSYSIYDKETKTIIDSIINNGNIIGIHPGFNSSKYEGCLIKAKDKLERIINKEIISIRQHWLRFSFKKTWKDHIKAGFKEDSTLGFNDRKGFRNSSALTFFPYDIESKKRLDINEIPLVLMDGHLYSYNKLNYKQIKKGISDLIDEVKAVRGEVSILWHPHMLLDPFNTLDGYVYLLEQIN